MFLYFRTMKTRSACQWGRQKIQNTAKPHCSIYPKRSKLNEASWSGLWIMKNYSQKSSYFLLNRMKNNVINLLNNSQHIWWKSILDSSIPVCIFNRQQKIFIIQMVRLLIVMLNQNHLVKVLDYRNATICQSSEKEHLIKVLNTPNNLLLFKGFHPSKVHHKEWKKVCRRYHWKGVKNFQITFYSIFFIVCLLIGRKLMQLKN